MCIQTDTTYFKNPEHRDWISNFETIYKRFKKVFISSLYSHRPVQEEIFRKTGQARVQTLIVNTHIITMTY